MISPTFRLAFCPENNGIDDLPNPVRLSITRTQFCITHHLGFYDILPIDERLDGLGSSRLVEVLRIEGWDLADVAVIQFVETSGLDDCHGYRGILRQSLGNGQTGGASTNNLIGQIVAKRE